MTALLVAALIHQAPQSVGPFVFDLPTGWTLEVADREPTLKRLMKTPDLRGTCDLIVTLARCVSPDETPQDRISQYLDATKASLRPTSEAPLSLKAKLLTLTGVQVNEPRQLKPYKDGTPTVELYGGCAGEHLIALEFTATDTMKNRSFYRKQCLGMVTGLRLPKKH